MVAILLAARVALALVFVVAGVAKLLDPVGTRRALLDFGVPAIVVGPLAVALPVVELAVALALLPAATAWIGALGALALVLIFVVAIGANLVRGRRPACHCFGQLQASPAGWPTLARNGVLAALAGLLVGSGPDASMAAQDWLTGMPVAQLLAGFGAMLLLALLVAEGWLLAHILGQNGRLLLRIEALEARLASGAGTPEAGESESKLLADAGLPIGAPAPTFRLPDLEGQPVTLDDLLSAGRPVLLLFVEAACGPCTSLMAEIGRWQREHADVVTVAVISSGAASMVRATRELFGLTRVLLQPEPGVAETFRVRGTPGAVLVTPRGKIDSGLVQGADPIRTLVTHLLTGAAVAAGSASRAS